MVPSENVCKIVPVICLFLCLCLAVVCCSPVTPQPTATSQNDPCVVQGTSSSGVQKWNGGVIPYTLSERLTAATKTHLVAEMQYWENRSGIVFAPRTDHQDYVHFELGERCCSFPGRVGSGIQMVYINSTCLQDHSLNSTLQRLTGVGLSEENRVTNGLPTSTSSPDTCGGYIMLNPHTNNNQIISSQHYPKHYPADLECTWKLIAPEGYAIKLTIHDIEIEQHFKKCEYDFLDVLLLNRRGEIISWKRMCGSTIPTTDINSSDAAVVRFHSDGAYSGKGFQLTYELEDLKTETTKLLTLHTLIVKNVTSNLCSVNNGGCDHNCTVNLNDRIRTCTCRPGYSLAQDGRSCFDINECKVDRRGCQQRCTNTEGSFQCHCKPGYGLNPDQQTCKQCGGHFNSSRGVITSPSYPSPYPSYQNCLWTIHTWSNHHLRITISNLDITTSDKCKTDFLKLKHGHFPHKRRLCGYYTNINYVIDDETTYFRFHTRDINSPSSASSGFRVMYTQVPANPQNLNHVTVRGRTVPYRTRLWVDSQVSQLT